MRKVIVISGANLFNGGTLSIMQDCLKYLNESLAFNYRIIALVNNKNDFEGMGNVELIEIASMRKSYFHRLYYEYCKYNSLSKHLNTYLWLSLNDMSSNIKAHHRAVYCHNPSPFRKIIFKDIIDQPQLFWFSIFYKYLYKINIHKNDYVIVQQSWIKKAFIKSFNLKPNKVIIARPLDLPSNEIPLKSKVKTEVVFFYPAVARPFKNFEVIIKAVKLLKKMKITGFKVVFTINGTENNYAKRIIKMVNGNKLNEIQFVGFLNRKYVADYYDLTSCLIFPSKLETWGLPITEFKNYQKPIFLADLPYAKETLGKYDKAAFFKPDDAEELSKLMLNIIQSEPINYSITNEVEYAGPSTSNWKELFDILLATEINDDV